ncbi:MAG: sugar phosphate nucleotidyltransferase [Promethearchaeota archaeon]
MSLPKNNLTEDIVSIILCAGEGIRIREFIQNIPKSLIKVYNKPILYHLISSLIRLKINSIFIITGHLREEIELYISSLFRKDESLKKKILLINSGNRYKKGPLYSFLSLTIRSEFIKENKIYLVFPGDTYFEPNLLEEIYHSIANNITHLKNKSMIFYQKIKAIELKTQFKSKKLVSHVKIVKNGSKQIIKEIQQKELIEIDNNKEINQIIPIFVLNYKMIIKIIEAEKNLSAVTIIEVLNHIIKQENILYPILINPFYRFIDIDTKSDLMSLKQKKKGKGQ